MQKIPARTAILLVLTIIVAVLGFPFIFKSSPKVEVASPDSQTQVNLEEISVDVEKQDRLSLLKETKERLEKTEWTNDPFSPNESSFLYRSLSSFRVTGIVMDTAGAYAVINETIVKTGDTLGGWKVTNILPNKVILKKDAEEFELHLWKE